MKNMAVLVSCNCFNFLFVGYVMRDAANNTKIIHPVLCVLVSLTGALSLIVEAI